MSSLTEFVGSVPHNYDQYLGPLFFEPYALDLFERLQGKSYQRILELDSGTGRVTRHLAELVKEEGQLFATDLNSDMLKQAKHALPHERITWQVDAHEIPYETEFFDAVVCQFGVMFFFDKAKALREIHRVVRPGGIFLFNTWDELQHNAGAYLSYLVVSESYPDDPPDFFINGPYAFFDTAEIKELLEAAGFSQVQIVPVTKVGSLNSPEQVANGVLEGTPLSSYLEERKAPKEALKQKVTASVLSSYPDLQLPMKAFVISAQKEG